MLPFEVVDITFNSSNGSNDTKTSIHIDDLISDSLNKDKFTIKTVSNDLTWNLTFLPVYAKTISIKFRASESYKIDTVTSENRIVLRDRYAIGIKSIRLDQQTYSEKGGIGSLELPLRGNLYGCVPFLDLWPMNPNLFDLAVEVSFDSGETWRQSAFVEDGIGSTILMDGDETSMRWRMNLQRISSAFNNIDSFFEDDALTRNVNSVLKTVSRYQSPATVVLPEKPLDKNVFVMQPKVMRRGDAYKRVEIGRGSGTSARFTLPFNILQKDLVTNLKVFVSGVPYERADTVVGLASKKFAFSDDYNEIIFAEELASGAVVAISLDEEPMVFEERSDGFYAPLQMLFDPDKNNIEISYQERSLSQKTMILPKYKTVFSLDASYIVEDSIKLVSNKNYTYTKVATIPDVLATDNTYYIDTINGTMRINSTHTDDLLQLSFSYHEPKNLSSLHYDIFYEQNIPAGIKIDKNFFTAIKITDQLNETNKPKLNLITGNFGIRQNPYDNSTKARMLSYGSIVRGSLAVTDNLFINSTVPEEIDYVDGYSEFLGLIKVDNEQTVEIQSNGGLVSFNLSAGALWDSEFGVQFGDQSTFSNLVMVKNAVNTLGDYYVSDEGEVTVYTGANSLTEGITIQYRYKDPTFDGSNKYSVNYAEGIIYALSNFNPTATITYKSANYKIAYDIAKHIPQIVYNETANSVSINTEQLDTINNQVKIFWTESLTAKQFSNYTNYFSPLINVTAFRFN